MPPIFKIVLRRNLGSKPDSRILYYLTDGTLTEVRFFDELFNSTNFVSNKDIRIVKCEKTGDDEGVSNGLGLIKLAKKYIESNPSFRKGYDKVLVVFDLDVYKNNLNDIINAIHNEKDILFGYTNPSFELVLLLCLDKNFISNLSEAKRKNIIENEFIGNDRYIYHLIKKEYHFDSKNRSSNFLLVANCVSNSIAQSINIYIDNASDSLTCNIPYLLSKINNNEIDDIVYFAPLPENNVS